MIKKNIDQFIFDEAIKYLGKYPATKKRLKIILRKKIRNKKSRQKINFPEYFNEDKLMEETISKLNKLKILNENHYLESLFNYYYQSLFSIKKIKYKLHQKGFDEKNIDEYISMQIQDNPELEIEILKKFIQKKKLMNLESKDLKKKLYQYSFSENSIYKIFKD
jgi:SOS response regulatory protein OraA/RecX